MKLEPSADIGAILSKRHHNGGDFWATADDRVYVGSPFSTLSSLGMLYELGVPRSHEAVRGGLDLVLAAWRDDGRIRLGPGTPLYPCYTAEAARVLCRYGYAGDKGVKLTVPYLLGDAHDAGGGRCNFPKSGRGRETPGANPGPPFFV